MPDSTAAQRHKLNRDPISDPHIILLEFQEDGQAAIIRLAINTEDIVHNGQTYTRANIDVQLPDTGSDDTVAQLTASNLDRSIGRIVDAARQRINVRMIVIDASDPDVAIIDSKNLIVVPSASGDSVQIKGTLGPRASLQEPVPFQRTTRNFFPGVWLA